jgi:peptidoglycan/LPS O-acetylase OafA/YrhL
MFHFLYIPISGPHGIVRSAKWIVRYIISSGFVGVSFFFILSGFILAYNYLDAQGGTRVSWRDFWVARLARVYPVYVFAICVAVLPYLHGAWCTGLHIYPVCTRANPAVTIGTELSLLQEWIPGTGWLYNPPDWSVSVEAVFYLLFPIIALGLARLNRGQLLQALGCAWGALVVMVGAYLLISPDGIRHVTGEYMPGANWLRLLFYHPIFRLPEFIMGVIAGRLYVMRRAQGVAAGVTFGRLTVGLASVLITIAIVGVLSLGQLPMWLLNNISLDPLFLLLIYVVAFEAGPVAWLFSLPAVVLLGEASYSMYILHYPIWDWMNNVLADLHVGFDAHSPGFFLIYLAVVVGTSVTTLYLIERPARRAIRQAWMARAQAPLARASAPARSRLP